MLLGVMVEGQEGLTWERWRRVMARSEELGFESLWRSDHLLSRVDAGRESLEAWVSLTLAAAETKRLRFGPLVSPITFRHPSIIARMALDLAQLSGGRLILGLGAGWNEEEHQAYGLPFPSAAERLQRLGEGLEVITRLLRGGQEPFSGHHYRLEPAGTGKRTESRPHVPVLIGGTGERGTLPLVARYADEWNLTTNSLALYQQRSERLARLCQARGRDPGSILRSVAIGFIVGGSAQELERRCLAMQRLDPRLAAVSLSEVPLAARACGWLVGSPETVAADLRAFASVGVQRAMLQHNDYEDLEALELIAREVLPAVA